MALHDIPCTPRNLSAAACGRYHVASSVATGLLKISPDLRSKKNKNPDKEKSSNLQIPPKLTPKCCIILL